MYTLVKSYAQPVAEVGQLGLATAGARRLLVELRFEFPLPLDGLLVPLLGLGGPPLRGI